ncbi:serine carboxypeptidase S28-domain-containing protein [Rhodocollybia butyracea]|uniref:Serine carboxypeptidase S28-domain-containing protein n=1 Tax=Rhodocollybia butyracea TaxID=206335 RepID=A0A9P5Q922_9AGAR|nr:serine carboxypeptidase S28-domain-containing protein [Rhodocollybia butyracea]
MFTGLFGPLALCIQAVFARNGNAMRAPIAPIPRIYNDGPVMSRNGTQLPPYSPIILSTPGEGNAEPFTGYLTNGTINGQIAQQQNGSTIVLEHRYYGLSNPVPNLSGKNLRYHTIHQAIEDLVYFANNVDLPQMNGAGLSPATAPWILIGGSYSGALTSWTMVNHPDVFWAGYASSAVVEAILDYWSYFEIIREFMPANCSADIAVVIAYVDEVFSSSDTLTHLDDVAGVRNNLWDWQSLQPETGPGAKFFESCDALEVKNGVNAPATGWGLENALSAWGSFWNSSYIDFLCGEEGVVDCLGTYNPNSTYFTSTALDNADRSWTWIICNEVGFLQEGPPPAGDLSAIVTRIVQPDYDIRQCAYMFSDVFASPADVPTAAGIANVNSAYKGWNISVDRLFFANGQRDPWRASTVSADGVDRPSTETQPIAIGNGFHTSDLLTANGRVDPTVLAVQNEALAYMKIWLAEWTPPSISPKREEPYSRKVNSSRFFKGIVV